MKQSAQTMEPKESFIYKFSPATRKAMFSGIILVLMFTAFAILKSNLFSNNLLYI